MNTGPSDHMIQPFLINGFQFTDRRAYLFNTFLGCNRCHNVCNKHRKFCKGHAASGTLVVFTEEELAATDEKVLVARVVVGRQLHCGLGFIRQSDIGCDRSKEWIHGGLYYVDNSMMFADNDIMNCGGILALQYIGRIDSYIVEVAD